MTANKNRRNAISGYVVKILWFEKADIDCQKNRRFPGGVFNPKFFVYALKFAVRAETYRIEIKKVRGDIGDGVTGNDNVAAVIDDNAGKGVVL